MVNLNVPFVLLQKETCTFRPSILSSEVIHHSLFDTADPLSENKNQANYADDLEPETPSSFLYDAALYISSYFSSAES